MSVQEIVFILLAIGTGLSAVAVVTSKNLVHAAIFLGATLAGVAAVFLVLHADFLALVQLLVYVGAIAVLFMFGLMLTNAPIGREALDSQQRGLGLAVSVALFGVLSALIVQAFKDTATVPIGGPNAEALGIAIFSRWILPFELLSILLTAALVGAIVLARREDGESGEQESMIAPLLSEEPVAEVERAGAGGGQ